MENYCPIVIISTISSTISSDNSCKFGVFHFSVTVSFPSVHTPQQIFIMIIFLPTSLRLPASEVASKSKDRQDKEPSTNQQYASTWQKIISEMTSLEDKS